MTIIEFFNLICYNRDKQQHRKEEIDKWKRAH